MVYDVVILGAGAAGLMCAAWLNEHSGLSVCVIEGNARPGMKIRISGGGKCNLTNTRVGPENYLGDPALVQAVLSRFGRDDLLRYVRRDGCEPVVRKGRYYFCPHSAQELVDLLVGRASKSRFFFDRSIKEVVPDAEGFRVQTSGETVRGRRVVVATGGKSYATVGATEIGVMIAQALGHAVVPFRPALAGLTLQKAQFWMKELSGISFPVTIRVGDKCLREDMLFAHRGISGPAVLSASLYWEKGTIAIDFLDGKPVASLLERGGKKKISTALPLPKRFCSALLQHLDIPDVPCDRLSPEQKVRIETAANYRFAPAGTFGFTKAEVSKGGIAGEELSVPHCESRRVSGLYLIGEVVDVTGELGGYNFQWAFASAVCAAEHIAHAKRMSETPL